MARTAPDHWARHCAPFFSHPLQCAVIPNRTDVTWITQVDELFSGFGLWTTMHRGRRPRSDIRREGAEPARLEGDLRTAPRVKSPRLCKAAPRCARARPPSEGTAARHFPCCWETGAVNAACDHRSGVPPTIPSGDPRRQSPLPRGTFQHGGSFVQPKAPGPDCSPHQSVPQARQSGPPDNRISENSVRLFIARTFAPLPIRPSGRLFVTRS